MPVAVRSGGDGVMGALLLQPRLHSASRPNNPSARPHGQTAEDVRRQTAEDIRQLAMEETGQANCEGAEQNWRLERPLTNAPFSAPMDPSN